MAAEYSRLPQQIPDSNSDSGGSSTEEEDLIEGQEEQFDETALEEEQHYANGDVNNGIKNGGDLKIKIMDPTLNAKVRFRPTCTSAPRVIHNPFNADEYLEKEEPGCCGKEYRGLTVCRWVCVALSVIFGLGVVLSFLYGFPCNYLDCSLLHLKFGMVKWQQKLNLGLYGDPHIWSAENEKPHIIITYRTLAERPPTCKWGWLNEEPFSAGVVAYSASDGSEIWRNPLFGAPTAMDCQHLDINNDGKVDCVIVGTRGLLAAMNGKTGDMIWYFHEHGKETLIKPRDIAMPWLIPDVDGDKFPDILALACIGEESKYHNKIILVSGHTGQLIGQPITGGVNCTLGLTTLVVLDTEMVTHRIAKASYFCHKYDGHVDYKKYTLAELYAKAIRKTTITGSDDFTDMEITYFPPIAIVLVKGRYFTGSDVTALAVQKNKNELPCPKRCSLVMQLKMQQSREYVNVWYYERPQATGMYPASALLRNITGRKDEFYEYVEIFLMKSWEYGANHNASQAERTYFSRTADVEQFVAKDEMDEHLEQLRLANEGLLPHPKPIESHRPRRDLEPTVSECALGAWRTEEVFERVTVVVFAKGIMYYDNFTLNPITLLCQDDVCEPEPYMLRGSVDIVELPDPKNDTASMIDFSTTFELNPKTGQYDLTSVLSRRSVQRQAELILGRY